MLCFAIAAMAGVLLARLVPQSCVLSPYGWLLFAVLAIWFTLTPKKSDPIDAPTIPDAYIPHILPRPGALAARGMNRFIIIAGLGFFLLAIARQNAWHNEHDSARLPARQWFDATLVAMGPSREHGGPPGRWRIPARLLQVDGTPADLPVRLNGKEGTEFRRGDIIRARVRMGGFSPRAHPGAFDFRFWLESDGLNASLDIVKPRRSGDRVAPYEVIPMDSPTLYLRARRLVDDVRAAAIARTLALGGEEGGMLAAMLYGYRKEIPDDVRDAFRRVGIGHVLAISGLHVGLIVGLLWWLGGWIGWSLRHRALTCLVLSIFYLGLSGR